ncbi:MAG TPA: hypothetical protein V6C78_02290 [Crinalium sp.]|jgi:hypothetical protein
MNDQSQSIFRKESLERLSSPEQLDQLMQVVRPRSWIPLASLGALVGVALLWSIFGRIPITATGKGILVHPNASSDELVGVVYFDSDQAGMIQPGTEMVLIPDAIASQAGGAQAYVESVSQPPITTLEAARQANPSELDALQAGSVQVVAELEQDVSNPNSYKWSVANSAQPPLSAGDTVTARIVIAQKAPITFVFPFLGGS